MRLQETESFDRGFYAGPFGWMSGAAAEFSVAIRSALLQPQLEDSAPASASLSVYTGVGIVPGSDASQEWAELELKVCAAALPLLGRKDTKRCVA